MPNCEICGARAYSNQCVQHKVREPIKKSPIKQKAYTIPKQSKKRAAQGVEYSKKRKKFLNQFPDCEVHGCNNKATDIHHQKGKIGELLTNEKYFLAVCRECHKDIELAPEWAKEMGYSCIRLKKD